MEIFGIFVASNIPRRYASLVSGNGFEGLEKLGEEAKQYIHPLPGGSLPATVGAISQLPEMICLACRIAREIPEGSFPPAVAKKG